MIIINFNLRSINNIFYSQTIIISIVTYKDSQHLQICLCYRPIPPVADLFGNNMNISEKLAAGFCAPMNCLMLELDVQNY